MLNQIKTLIQYLLPKQLLTTLFGWLAKQPLGKLTTWIITVFVKLYKVNMREALIENVADYKTFNDFFARKLKDELRPIDISPNAVIMPADGVISQCGHIEENLLLQAKGHLFTLDSLVACHPNMIKAFTNGTYVTTYLSPKDYHRFHMPCDGALKEMLYVPGSLFSVNQSTTENIPNIFSRNERVICFFKTKFGPMAQIFVGATIVGSIEIEWEGTITPPRDSVMKRWVYPEGVKLKKGQDIGCFKLGSTVITLFGANSISLVPELNEGSATKVGQKLAEKVID